MPFVTIRIKTSEGEAQGLALVDSGADRTIVPAELMEALGVPWASLSASSVTGLGAGGKFETRSCQGEVFFREWKFCDELLVAPAGSLPAPLLGRSDFFKHFLVKFTWHRDPPIMDIDPISPPGGARTRRSR